MLPTSSSNGSEFSGHSDRIPLSGPARRLRALREALRHNRLVRPNLHSDRPPIPAPNVPGKPASEIRLPAAERPNL